MPQANFSHRYTTVNFVRTLATSIQCSVYTDKCNIQAEIVQLLKVIMNPVHECKVLSSVTPKSATSGDSGISVCAIKMSETAGGEKLGIEILSVSLLIHRLCTFEIASRHIYYICSHCQLCLSPLPSI